MSIKKWYDRGCNYNEGVMLYSQLKGHNVNLLRLFMRKESKLNLDKLKYELSKFDDKSKLVDNDLIAKGPIANNVENVSNPSATANKSTQQFYRLNELHPDLHALSIKQRNDFQLAIAAHSKLVLLHPDEESAALELSIYIENLFDAIATAQKVLDYYVKNKIVIDLTPRTYADFTPEQRIQARNNKRISVAKYEKKLKSLLATKKDGLDKSETTKLQVSIEKAEAKLLQHQVELTELNELINGK